MPLRTLAQCGTRIAQSDYSTAGPSAPNWDWATKIAVGCPFCNVMLNDGTTQHKQEGAASEDIEVLDVAALLLESVKE